MAYAKKLVFMIGLAVGLATTASSVGAQGDPPPTCFGRVATIVSEEPGRRITGTEGPDVIVGSDEGETILGLGGRDFICAGGGDDVVRGGNANDRIRGGEGDDRLFGGAGRDALFGGAGDDDVRGGNGKDRVNGGDGADVLRGERDAAHEHIFGYFRDSQRMVRDDRFKLIYYPLLDRYQFFDLVTDPFETADLAGSGGAQHREAFQSLKKMLTSWRERHPLPPTP